MEDQFNNVNEEEEIQLPQEEPANEFHGNTKLREFQMEVEQVKNECSKIIVGNENLIELMLAALLSGGHILLEGVPGIAKTLSAKVVAKSIDCDFSRIQFTPDLLPADVTGTSIYQMDKGKFKFERGPIFSNIVLIDEINRSPAKTQAALFEVMEEKQITHDGTTYQMDFPFMVIATQNPIDQEGTYRLPEAQLDRFLMKINLGYPSHQEEEQILYRFQNTIDVISLDHINKVLSRSSLKHLQETIASQHISEQIISYITQLILSTRNHPKVYLGGSPRASLAVLKTAKVMAAIAGREFVIPDDVKYVLPYVLNHRIILTPDAEMEGITSFDVINEIIKTIDIPR
ncbi:MAG TPA: MoxR family ATPase [Saprospiraceae bacterium]|nr:MoxR family ATPase [Saprospiraceae bacterium]MCB9329366.1 MoxR family ATPase [Lewinellaceae bacterium]HPK09058.1 MoxR family ATPase [Saprospiraceae bacterium]HRX27747.1 MoxR family ATPase [Saprospiraceae bacterium]